MSEIDSGSTGLPMEILMYDYLAGQFGKNNVIHEPGKYPSKTGVTCPDVLVRGQRDFYIDVTISSLPTGDWVERPDPKSYQRKLFRQPKNPESTLGIAVYQQIIMLPKGYEMVKELIMEAMTSGMSSESAQSAIDLYCAGYAYSILSAFSNDWEATSMNLRKAMGL